MIMDKLIGSEGITATEHPPRANAIVQVWLHASTLHKHDRLSSLLIRFNP
jgi:hypothetical protein